MTAAAAGLRSGAAAVAQLLDGRRTERVAVVRMRRTRRIRWVLVVGVLAAIALVLVGVGLAIGDYTIAPGDLLATLTGSGSRAQEFIVFRLRMPRVALGVLVGIALALAGALLQLVLANPLASPDLLGVSQGASAGAVLGTLVLGVSGAAVSGLALLGAFAAGAAIYALAWRGGVTGIRFIVVGIGVAFVGTAVVNALLIRADVRDAQSALVWLAGSLAGPAWGDIALLAVLVAVLLAGVALLAPRLRILQLGDDTARGLGLHAGLARGLALALAVALAAVATAAAGPVAFVGFVCAPIARHLLPGGTALVATALTGVVLVLGADQIAQHLLPGGLQVPVGVVTAVVAAPYLLVLLARGSRRVGA